MSEEKRILAEGGVPVLALRNRALRGASPVAAAGEPFLRVQ